MTTPSHLARVLATAGIDLSPEFADHVLAQARDRCACGDPLSTPSAHLCVRCAHQQCALQRATLRTANVNGVAQAEVIGPDACAVCSGSRHICHVPDHIVRNGVAEMNPGYQVATPCAGARIERVRDAYNAARFNGCLHDATFETFVASNPALTTARRTLVDLAASWHERDKGVLLRGRCGVGKTHLVTAFARALIERQAEVLFIDLPTLIRTLRESVAKRERAAIVERAAKVRVLIFDDLGRGRERMTDFVAEAVDHIIDTRYRSRETTVGTTNLTPEELDEWAGPRIASRIASMMRTVHCVGEDWRSRT